MCSSDLKGNIYRGVRMVNWDPLGKTALSDEEVIYKEVQSRLFHVRYPIVHAELASLLKVNKSEWSCDDSGWKVIVNGTEYSGKEFITIATVRPETILGDTGSGATASAVLDSNGTITSITVNSGGSGYTTVPNVIITGTNVNVAVASVRLTQSTYDTFDYRIVKDKNENYQYLRLQSSATTTLASDLTLTAT